MIPNLGSPTALVAMIIIIPIFVAAIAYFISLLPYGGKVARDLCILTSYLVLALVLLLIEPIITNSPIIGTIYSFQTPIGSVSFSIYLDPLAIIPTILSATFASLALTFSLKYFSRENRYLTEPSTYNVTYSFMLVLLGSIIGVCFSSNIVMILLFWEITGLCSYALVSFLHEQEASRSAALKTFIITHIGTLGLLLGVIIIYPIVGTFNIHEWGSATEVSQLVSIAMALFLIGILPKSAQFPLHTWLPDATIAPTPVTAYMFMLSDSMGLYAFSRIFAQVFIEQITNSNFIYGLFYILFGELKTWNLIISSIGAITLLIGAFFSLIETDIKKIIAYIHISFLGTIVMALGLGTGLGLIAGLYAITPHVFFVGLLFLAAGAAIYRTGKTSIILMGGLQRSMPITTACCAIGVMSSASFPFLGYFTALWLTIHAFIEVQAPVFLLITLLGSVLKTAAVFRLFHSTFLGNSQLQREEINEVSTLMLVPMLLLTLLIIANGVFPQVLLQSLIIPSVVNLGIDIGSITVLDEIVLASGLWNPFLAAAISFLYLGITAAMIYVSSTTSGLSQQDSEDAMKPFLFGEDVNALTQVSANNLYNYALDVLQIRRLANLTNIDRLYYMMSRVFKRVSGNSLKLDINQQYHLAFLYFLVGALVLLALVLVMG